MNRPLYESVDILIVGGGIAGLSVAREAVDRGLRTLVVEKQTPGSGASGTPCALLNPATGRRARKVWKAEECLETTRTLLEQMQARTDQSLWMPTGVLRPALDRKMARKMRETVESESWQQGWVRWLEPAEAVNRFPLIPSVGGALWIPHGGSVRMPQFLKVWRNVLSERGAAILESVYLLSENLPDMAISEDGTLICRPKIVVMATGQDLCREPYWKHLPLHRVKGQTLSVVLDPPLPFQCSLSSLGYIARCGSDSDRLVLGSTYEHSFDHERPDEQGAQYLLDRMERTIPDLRSRVIRSEGWAGIRVTTPDKKPFAGRHPECHSLYTMGGLGSKGLMLGPTLGRILVSHILDESPIPAPFSIERMS